MLVGGGEDDDIINVDNDVLDFVQHLFHPTLKRGWTSQQTHR